MCRDQCSRLGQAACAPQGAADSVGGGVEGSREGFEDPCGRVLRDSISHNVPASRCFDGIHVTQQTNVLACSRSAATNDLREVAGREGCLCEHPNDEQARDTCGDAQDATLPIPLGTTAIDARLHECDRLRIDGRARSTTLFATGSHRVFIGTPPQPCNRYRKSESTSRRKRGGLGLFGAPISGG